jgi:RsfA family transcription factor
VENLQNHTTFADLADITMEKQWLKRKKERRHLSAILPIGVFFIFYRPFSSLAFFPLAYIDSRIEEGGSVLKSTRQDAWSDKEDVLLANTVLDFIQEGKTQLDAFRDVAVKLNRTAAACGFRWNASLRQYYQTDIEIAKQQRKQQLPVSIKETTPVKDDKESISLEAAIDLLEKVKQNFQVPRKEPQEELRTLKEENAKLKDQLKRYQDACIEMEKLCRWVIEEAETK